MKRGIKLALNIFFGILLIGIVSASYCCERTTSGAYCQNVDDPAECSTGISPITGEAYRSISALCASTSYCKPGTCINQKEGTCMSNTAQIVCEGNYGYWSPSDKSSLAQCKAGCCIMGNQAAFVTQVTCNKIASDYGISTTFNSGITDELTCLASANPSDEGACVYTKDFATTCERTTRKDCNSKGSSLNATFHEGYLCSAVELGSNCAKTTNTQCDDKNNVRFVDSCGNFANIYDASKVSDEGYWTKIQDPTCGDGKGNKDSSTCGSCDYYSGSMCQQRETGESVSYGDYLCKDLDCVDYTGEYYGNGQYPRHGESWCASVGAENTVGSSYYKLLCYNGDVTIEECDSTRQEVCAQTTSDYSDFTVGNCRANVWEDCTAQNNSEDCEDIEARDCKWISYRDYFFNDETGTLTNDNDDITGTCVPRYSPGFERDKNDEIIGGEMCTLASSVCFVTYEKSGILGSWKCKENCYCDGVGEGDSRNENDGGKSWASNLNKICTALGDCGEKKNYLGDLGKKQNTTKREKYDEEED